MISFLYRDILFKMEEQIWCSIIQFSCS